MGLYYAGVVLSDPFVSPWPEAIQTAAEWVEANIPVSRCFPLWERLCHSSRPTLCFLGDGQSRFLESAATLMTAATGILEDTKIKLNTLIWPHTACRWAHFHTIVSMGQLAAIRGAVGKSRSGKALKMEWWNDKKVKVDEISTTMYMLEARPLAGDNLALLTLVDQRYYWWKPVNINITEGTTTWASIIASAASGCGTSVTIETSPEGASLSEIPAEYKYPSIFYRGRHEHAPVLLDAVCQAVGLRVCRLLGGTVKAQDSRRAAAIAAGNAGSGGVSTRGGGPCAFTKPNDASAMMPRTVTMQCTKANFGVVNPNDPIYSKSVVISTLANRVPSQVRDAPELKGIKGHSFTKILSSSIVADFQGGIDPVNELEIIALAERMALDYWLYQRALFDQSWNGIHSFVPEAHSDRYEWEYRSDGISTRMLPGDMLSGTLGHVGTYPTPIGSINADWCASFGLGLGLETCITEPKSTDYWCANFGLSAGLKACVADYIFGVRGISGNAQLVRGDVGHMIEYEGSGHTLTLFDIDTTNFPADAYFAFCVRNMGTGALLVAPTGAETINNVNAAISILPGQSSWIYCTGTEWFTSPGRPATGVREISSSPYTVVVETDYGKNLVWTGAGTLVLNEPAAGYPLGFHVAVNNHGSSANSIIEYTRPAGGKDAIPLGWGQEIYVPDTMDGTTTARAMNGVTIFGVRKITGNFTLTRGDCNRMIEYEGSGHTITLFDIDSAVYATDAYFAFCVRNLGTGTLTVTPAGAETINNTTSLRVDPCQGCWIFCDGTEWYTVPGTSCPQSGGGAPSHSAPEGTRYFDKTNDRNYYNTDGGTTWLDYRLANPYDMLGTRVWSERAVTSAWTINASDFLGWTTMGSTGPYTGTFGFSVTPYDGYCWGFRCLPSLTGIVTLDLDGTEEIQGPRGSGGAVNRTRAYVKNENVVLMGDGANLRVVFETMLEVGFSAYINSAQTITTGAAVKVVCDTEDWDINANFATGTHTPTAPGIYRYTAAIKLIGDVLGVAGLNALHFYKNGALYKTVCQFTSAAVDDVCLSGSIEMSMNGSTDYCDLYIQHGHTVSLLTATQTGTHFSGTRIRRDIS